MYQDLFMTNKPMILDFVNKQWLIKPPILETAKVAIVLKPEAVLQERNLILFDYFMSLEILPLKIFIVVEN